MNAVGGYFELELTSGTEYHENAVRLNTGRNAFEYIIQAKQYQKVFIPFYTCHVLLQPLIKMGIPYEYYGIDAQFEPVFDYNRLRETECFLYTNYFGLKDAYLPLLKSQTPNLIVDNAQAFFSFPLPQTDTFYSARKFFGVPDGAYLYTDLPLGDELETDQSYGRCAHLLIRTDKDAESGYPEFKKNDEALDNNPMRKMSRLTQKILGSIDYKQQRELRRRNFSYIHQALAEKNQLHLSLHDDSVPMIYPYLSKEPQLRNELIQNRIYVATYWPEVLKMTNKYSIDHQLAQNLIPLPIDPRYNLDDMDIILKHVMENDN